MKASLFITYPLRSLVRGGNSTRLAIICITIGVLVVVAIQSIGLITTSSYADTNGLRIENGGDISVAVGDPNAPITQHDLAFFDQLRHTQTISNYTPVNLATGTIAHTTAPFQGLLVQIVNPQQFPLVAPPTFLSPSSASLRTLLTGNQVVVTQTFITYYHMHLGEIFNLQIQSPAQNRATRTLHVRLSGVVANTGMYPSGNTFLLLSAAAYQAAAPSLPLTYTGIDITSPDQAHTDLAVHAIQQQTQRGLLPPLTTQTVAGLQQHVQVFSDQETQLQELAGLLALLISGLGIMNTMQVLLSRRTVEIAMLKTAGYSWRNLALLFGIETGVIGFIGGLLGTGIALAVSYGVVTFLLSVPFQFYPQVVVSGILLGTVTALIFGLLPIVQSARIRPIRVLRELSASVPAMSRFAVALLYCIIVALFCLLSSLILQNILLGCLFVCGAVLFLLLLGLCFRPIIWGISNLPISDRMALRDLIVPLCGLVLSVLLGVFFSAGVGILLALLFLALGGAIPFLPPSWKINMRIALRNIGRRPMRSTMLMLILFVGVFVIGGIQVIGQDLQNQLTTAVNQVLSYNVVAKVSQDEASTMQAQLPALSGLLSSYSTTVAATSPIMINGQPWQSFFSTQNASQTLEPRVLHSLDGVEGYDLAQQKFPDPRTFQIRAGRNLNASDAHTNNVLIPYTPPTLANTIPLNVGSTLTVASTDGKTRTTLMVVGEYTISDTWFTTVSPILTDQQVVRTLAPAGGQTIFYLKVNPTQVTQAETHIENSVPNVSFVQTPASRVNDYLTGLSSIVWTFTALASFVLLAGIVIMANAVILDLLERRRELGILKAIGYTQKTLQGEILLEYGIIGGVGAVLAIFLIMLLANVLGNLFLHSASSSLGKSHGVVTLAFTLNGPLLVGLIIGAILLVLVTALLTSWRTVQIRPLEVLRYE